jgi:hypothetical protein
MEKCKMIIYYNKQTMKITQEQSKDTIPMTDELMADYRHYASNLQDKSLELVQEVGQVPYLVKYRLDEDGNRYSHYLDEVDEDGYKLPDMEAIELARQEALDNEAKQEAQKYLDSTDWYYARLAETGEEVPAEVVAKRKESRNMLRSGKEGE